MRIALLSIGLLGAAGPLLAQPGMSMGPGPSASAARMPQGMRGWHMDRDNTPGWSMMTRAERAEHQRAMRSFTDHAQCQAYREQHRAQMAERAKERGRAMPAAPRGDACAGLKKP